MELLVLAGAFALILIGAELFTNGIEWAGRKLDLGEGAVGSVLAAVGTALPETMIPLVAIILGSASASGAHDAEGIGVGAVLGAPFMLATLAMFVTGLAVVLRARRRVDRDLMPVDTAILWHDMRAFALSYALAIAAAFLPADLAWARAVVAVVLILLYARYVKGHLETERREEEASDLAPLRFGRLERHPHEHGPRLRVIGVQVVASLAAIIAGAVVFVDAVSAIAGSAGVDPTIVALVIAPVATELPEKFNSIIWIRQGKDTLAMGNITGAMVFQSCIPTVIAIVLAADRWVVSPETVVVFASAAIAFASSAVIFAPMAARGRLTGRALLSGGVFYVIYLAVVLAAIIGA